MNGWLVGWLVEPERRPICQDSLHNEWIIDKEMIFNWIQIYSWTIVCPEWNLLKVGISVDAIIAWQQCVHWIQDFKRQLWHRFI